MDDQALTFRLRPAASGSRQGWGTVARSAVYYARPALLVFAAVVALGVLAALIMPAKYRSEARLLTLPSDYYAVPGQDKSANDSAEPFKPEQLTNVEMQLLSSQDLQRAAVTGTGAAPNDPAAIEKARQDFARGLSIERVDNANVIELGYTAGSPTEAAARLRKLLDVYFATRAKVLTSGRSALIAGQRDAAGRDLAAADTALRNFQEGNGIVDIQGQVSGAIAIDTALRQDLATTRADLSQTQGTGGRLRGSSGQVPRTVELYRDDTEAAKAVADMQAQILTLEAKKADLQGRYMQDSPLILQLDKQISGLRSAIDKQSGQLREAKRVGRNSYYDATHDRILQSDADASGQSAKLGRLDQELSGSQSRLRNLNELAAVIAQLKTRRDVAEERYRALSTQLQDARSRELEANTGSTNVRVIQQPTIPDARGNSPLLLIAGAVIAGLACAAATLFVLIARRDRFLDRNEVVERLGLPVAADFMVPRPGARQHARLPLLADGASSRRGRVVALVGAEPSAYGEELRALVRTLESQSGGTVATVTFEETAYQLERGNLAGLIPQDDGRSRVKVGTTAWTIDRTGERLLASLRDAFQWTILLIPPVAAGEEGSDRGLEAAALADDVLLLVRTEVTRRPAIDGIVDALDQMNVPVRGVVLTGRRIDWPRFVRSLD